MKMLVYVVFSLILLVTGCAVWPKDLPLADLAPSINTFDASPSSIRQGDITQLRWNVYRAGSVVIDQGIGNVALSGSIPVAPVSSTFYTLTAVNSFGISTARTQVLVAASADTSTPAPVSPRLPPFIRNFTANRTTSAPGEPVVLNWDIAEATQVTISSFGTVNPRDSMTVYPQITTTYNLTATNSNGSSTQSVLITVASQPSTPGVLSMPIQLVAAESGAMVKGSTAYTLLTTPCAGDTSSNLASRAFLSFNISAIPQNAIIREAVLDLGNSTRQGNPTYTLSMWGNMGAFEVYHLQYGKLFDLDSMAYNRAAKLVEGGRFTTYPLSPWLLDAKNAEDGEPVIQKLVQAGVGRCQFRVQFFTSTNWDSVSDMLCLDNAVLTIKYSVP